MPSFPIHPKTILEIINKKDEEEREKFWKFANFKSTEVHLPLTSSYHFHTETHASCHFTNFHLKPIQALLLYFETKDVTKQCQLKKSIPKKSL
jgi:hypothetical protein